MAPRTNAPDLNALLKPSTGLKPTSRGKSTGDNPLAGFVAQSVGTQGLCLPIPLSLPDGTKADAKTVNNLLRRDVGDQALQLSVQFQDGKGNVLAVKRTKDAATGKTVSEYPAGIREVHFLAKAGKKERAYTADDIRAWHLAQTGQKITGKVPPAVRDAYKAAHGHATTKVETTA